MKRQRLEDEMWGRDLVLSTDHDRNLETNSKPPKDSGKPKQAPWSWNTFHDKQEILEELKPNENDGCFSVLLVLFMVAAMLARVMAG